MNEPIEWAMVSGSSLAGLVVLAIVGLKGWREWIALQAQTFDGRRAPQADHGSPPAGARIELADLKERVRKLEAIAAGVDL